jgi:hypothetical protein
MCVRLDWIGPTNIVLLDVDSTLDQFSKIVLWLGSLYIYNAQLDSFSSRIRTFLSSTMYAHSNVVVFGNY